MQEGGHPRTFGWIWVQQLPAAFLDTRWEKGHQASTKGLCSLAIAFRGEPQRRKILGETKLYLLGKGTTLVDAKQTNKKTNKQTRRQPKSNISTATPVLKHVSDGVHVSASVP